MWGNGFIVCRVETQIHIDVYIVCMYILYVYIVCMYMYMSFKST